MVRANRIHSNMKGADPGASPGAAAQYRWRWPGGSGWSRGRAAWGVRLPDGFLPLLERELNRRDFTFGQFGENFTVEGLADSEVCIGDRYRIGGALFEVTQPRVTCYCVGIRMNEPRMAALLVAHHRSGFYLRVIEEGKVGADDAIIKVVAGPEGLTIAAADALLYLPKPAQGDVERALRIPALSPGWKSSFEAVLQQMAHKMGQQSLSGNFDKLLVSGAIAQILILSLGQSHLMKLPTTYLLSKSSTYKH